MQGLQSSRIGATAWSAAAACARMRLLAGLLLALSMTACSTSVQTPLPDLTPVSSSSLSQEEQQKAVEELNRKRATHEQDAEKQIEQSR